MANPTVPTALVGARAKLSIAGKPVGVFTTCNYSVTIDTQPIYILGKYNAAELVITGMGTVEVDVSGLRVFDRSPYQIAGIPKLQDLLTNGKDISLAIIDRQNPERPLLTVEGVKATTFSSSTSARGVYDLSVHFSGVTLWDESDTEPQEDIDSQDFG